jgi:hypothetical protein
VLKFVLEYVCFPFVKHDLTKQNQQMPKQFTTATMEGTRKKGRPYKRCRDEFEEDLNVIGITNRVAVVSDQ